MAAAAQRREVDELIRRCYAGLAASALASEAMQRLRRILTVDAAFFATVDPATLLFTSAISETPLREEAPRFLANELAGADVNQFTELAARRVPVRWLDDATEGHREQSERYVSIMRPIGLGDELRVVLRTGDTAWGVLCLHREDGAAGFDERDARILASLAPHLGEGLRRATLAGGFATTRHAAHGIVVLDDEGAVRSVNDAAERWLAEVPTNEWPVGASVPLPVLGVALAVRAAPGDVAATTARLRTNRGQWLSIHASRLHGEDGDQTVVILEPPEPTQLVSLVLDAHGLTTAQSRVVALVLRGWSTQQIVNELRISAHTVQEHLKAVFDKMGVRSRRELAAALLHDDRG